MKKNNQILTVVSGVILSFAVLGVSSKAGGSQGAATVQAPSQVASYDPGPLIPNPDPDVELSDGGPLDEETGLEAPDQGPDGSPDQGPPDVTQGSINQAHGFYSHGSLTNPSQFELEGDGFIKIFRPRNRGFATYDLTMVVGIAASQLHHDYPNGERLQIGDVCAQHGRRLAEHSSHQNGLDADIAYPRVNRHEQDPNTTKGFDELFVTSHHTISPNFDEQRTWAFIKNLVGTGRIVRFFMDPVIKKTLCRYAKKIGEYDSGMEVLRRIRPLKNHKDHVHVRITCPRHSSSCRAQQEPHEGSGCEEVGG